MESEPIISALVEVIPMPDNDIFDGDPGAFTNFYGRARDVAGLRQLAESAFAPMGLVVADVANPVITDAEAEQPVAAREALARIAAGAPWAYDTFRVYEAP